METKNRGLNKVEIELRDSMELLSEQLHVIKQLSRLANEMDLAIEDPHDFRRIYMSQKDLELKRSQYLRAVRYFTRKGAENSNRIVELLEEVKKQHES